MLGMMKWIIDNDKIDKDYIRSTTNGAFLVDKSTKKLVMSNAKYLVWDEKANKAVEVAALDDSLKPIYPSVTVSGDVPKECEVPETAAITGTYTVKVDGADIEVSPFQSIVDSVQDYTPEYASSICEVPADDIVKLAKIYAEETPSKIQISQGTNRYWNGHLPTRAAIQMAAITGNVGKQYANVNWAGGGLMRILFSVTGTSPYEGHKATPQPGTQWMSLVAKQEPYPVKLIWFNNYGWGTQSPEGNKLLHETLPQLDFVITSEQIMNSGAELSDLVLPISSYYERALRGHYLVVELLCAGSQAHAFPRCTSQRPTSRSARCLPRNSASSIRLTGNTTSRNGTASSPSKATSRPNSTPSTSTS